MRFMFLIGLLVFLAGCKTIPVKQAVELAPRAVNLDDRVRPIAITKVAAKLKRGKKIGELQLGIFCGTGMEKKQDIYWRQGGTANFSSEELIDVFREELESNGWPVVGTTEDLFTGYVVSGAEILVAAKIKEIESAICIPGYPYNRDSKGSIFIQVEWQIYNPSVKKIIGTIQTNGSSILEKPSVTGDQDLLDNAFSVSVNNLLASNEFWKIVNRLESGQIMEGKKFSSPIQISNLKKGFKTKAEFIENARRSTVVIRNAVGYGSGFAISDGSLVLTNAHVVGNAKNVSVTVNNISLDATVVRIDNQSDLALLSLINSRIEPLYLEKKNASIGSGVYAIGAPLDETLSGTVTKGILSSFRKIEGQNFLQADVAINPGNSGGPLLDETGNVIGISTAAIVDGGSQVGLNLFIPIDVAFEKLNLKIK